MSRISAFAVRAYRAARTYQSPAAALRDALAVSSVNRRSWSGRARVRRYFDRYAPDVQPVATLRLRYGSGASTTTAATAWHGVPVTLDERRGMWVTHETRRGVVVLAWHRSAGAAEAFAAGIACRRLAVPDADASDWR